MIKCGVDILENKRFDKSMESGAFRHKIFHHSELQYNGKERSIFVLKEAVMKAIGKKIDWKDLEIVYDKGKPRINMLDPGLMKDWKGIECSVSHDGDYTIGFVVIELK